ncbi:hypothetical protein FA13DRAFT_314052 [Coprinellus micaceus]|uniref:Uncharacterized protein n=1 Tax=Coprinellus micaceus TaxID=71717 RepID=A0A4Y7TCN5_COPMI|nr:hypothetical protein FA13DRAFT_314052 [Coprinellus micaceus]
MNFRPQTRANPRKRGITAPGRGWVAVRDTASLGPRPPSPTSRPNMSSRSCYFCNGYAVPECDRSLLKMTSERSAQESATTVVISHSPQPYPAVPRPERSSLMGQDPWETCLMHCERIPTSHGGPHTSKPSAVVLGAQPAPRSVNQILVRAPRRTPLLGSSPRLSSLSHLPSIYRRTREGS